MTDRVVLPVFVSSLSSGYVVGALAIEVADPLPLLTARFVLAALIMVPFALHRGRWRGAPLGRLAVVVVLLQIVQFGGIYGGFALGVPAALSALVMLGLSPLVTTALAVTSGRSTPTAVSGPASRSAWSASGSASRRSSGAPGSAPASRSPSPACSACPAARCSRPGVGCCDPGVSAAVQSVTGAIVVAPATVVFGGRVDVSSQLVLSLAWIVVGMAVISLLAFVYVLRHHAASSVAALLLVVPPVTAIASALTLGETLHPASGLGMVVAMVGVGAVAPRGSAHELVPQLDHARGARRTSVGRMGGRARGGRRAACRSQNDRHDRDPDLVEQARVGELRRDVPAADHPQLAVSGGVDHLVIEVGDRGALEPHVVGALEHG